MITAWTPEQAAALRDAPADTLPRIGPADLHRLAEGIDIWDSWPVRAPDGSLADACGHEMWVALSAPAHADAGVRHDVAELRALTVRDGRPDLDLGPLFGPGAALGTRQWAGSTVLDGGRVTAYYTAAGTFGVDPPGFRQRLAVTTGALECRNGRPVISGWSTHREIAQPDTRWYDSADAAHGEPGFIKAFRDPCAFVDPATSDEYLLFTASLTPERSATDFNGAIGLLRRDRAGPDRWRHLGPLLTADGVNNELERPHVVVRDGRYYLFFSTQWRTFHPDITAPTGLYGFVAADLEGPYEPLNGHGLVFRNPPERPLQAYSWTVLNDLSVVGFVDAFGVDGATGDSVFDTPAERRTGEFGGTLSPAVRLRLEGTEAGLAAG